ncbi:MAG: malto-oligosyltrehalose synthase [Acidimicrobiales bacterium]
MPAPTSTYRLQLGPDLTLDDARDLVARLRDLGIGHLYLSPVLEAAPGSTHGYDTVDHGRISTAIGGISAFDRLAATAHAAGMGLVVDVVPNHMSIAAPHANRWWWDVLENGPMSRFARHFDVTWESSEVRQVDTVLMPILGDHYGVVLEAGELVLERGEHGFTVRYFDHVLPLSPRSIVSLLRPIVATANDSDLGFVVDALEHLAVDRDDAQAIARRHRDLSVLRRMLAGALTDDGIAARVDQRLSDLGADPDALHEVLEQQHYQLCHWRRAERDLDYRRFFDIDTLIGVRIEDPDVFADTHALILELVREGRIDGLRIDHPDGLSDPAGYLDQLDGEAPATWTVVEKILEPGEHLPEPWPVAGTTGYDFLYVVDGVFRSAGGVAAMTDWWQRHIDRTSWDDTVRQAKTEILTTVLAADVSRVADVGLQLCEQHRRHRDHTRHDVTHAVRAVVRAMPVYRTYVRPGSETSAADRRVISDAVARAAETDTDIDADLYTFLGEVLCGKHEGEGVADEFVRRFQQLTGPAMAKSVEDTSFYRYLPVPAANEVGGAPGEPVVDVEHFHRHNARMQRDWPETMTALSTHDTKRSADVRSRLDALTAVSHRWLEFLEPWMDWCDERWSVDPHRPTTVLALQTVVGAWPIDSDRLRRYLEKATKEAKVRTSWTSADAAFDEAVATLADALLGDATFVAEVEALVDEILVPGRHVALAKTLLHLASPGVPDCYQGSELWDLSLVDPDNRRPVDHQLRADLSAELAHAGGPDLELGADDEGLHKLWLTRQALGLRRLRPGSFGAGETGRYEPIDVNPGVVAFRRGDDVVVATSLTADHPPFTLDLPAGEWTDLLTGMRQATSVVVHGMALLERRAT